ncbi:hypothetical protein [Caulobacter sp.]|uniref:hypothetical protein n=1 Tax=Caulobacter sp. TaxID=78 RepID=UPI003BB17892
MTTYLFIGGPWAGQTKEILHGSYVRAPNNAPYIGTSLMATRGQDVVYEAREIHDGEKVRPIMVPTGWSGPQTFDALFAAYAAMPHSQRRESA